jgi:hypothetical protein
MVIQAYQTFQEFNQTDLAGLFLYPANTWGGFIPLVLSGLFIIVMLSTFFSQRRLTGKGDFFASFAVAGFFTAIIAYLMTLIDGLISTFTLTITIVVAILGVILLFVSREK